MCAPDSQALLPHGNRLGKLQVSERACAVTKPEWVSVLIHGCPHPMLATSVTPQVPMLVLCDIRRLRLSKAQSTTP